MPDPWLSLLVAALTGGLMGAVINVLYQRWSASSAARGKESGALEALKAELRRSQALCKYNAGLKENTTGPFVQFPTDTAQAVSFTEREKYPRLSEVQPDLVHYTLGILHLNQLIDLHHRLWISPEQATGVSLGASGRREQLRMQICDICSGSQPLNGVGSADSIILPDYLKGVASRIDSL